MSSVLDDPAVLNPLPARQAALTVSSDVPSEGAVRPFGLTRAKALGEGEAVVSLPAVSYDAVRQLNVDAGERPFVDSPDVIVAGTSYDTQYDMQWFVDQD
ncbi:putative ATP-grasp-modified RiPP [Saccharopolyspora pogona]|uniref:putative ATP-grasp-modified RiPP n=1 Tax=Saccharopolyspora pogona TaxID=333966 RepID=UPI0016857146|nr:putative ATP-grasp-modified RiPP [Saccharopolyspora pogona]